MKCPYCDIAFHDNYQQIFLGEDIDGQWALRHMKCPACNKLIAQLINGNFEVIGDNYDCEWVLKEISNIILVKPKSRKSVSLDQSIPLKLRNDYKEACLILHDSPKASAALSRRCLQHLLRDYAKVNKSSLYNEIQEVIDREELPNYIAESIDAIRNIGNIAAHPNKEQNTSEIVDVEFEEAEWCIEVLDALFDFYFVRPKKEQQKKDNLNNKLKRMGKNKML